MNLRKFVLKFTATIRYFQKKCTYQLDKKYSQTFVHSIITVKFREREKQTDRETEREIAKEKFYAPKC